MESWFHGTSSGIDPLCIYFNKPLVIEGKEDIAAWNSESIRGTGLHAFLWIPAQKEIQGNWLTPSGIN